MRSNITAPPRVVVAKLRIGTEILLLELQLIALPIEKS